MAIDDFAFRKGSNYGTLICDLNTHQPIDLLPNRTKASVTDWLTMHSEVVLVIRDGSNIYRAGIDAVNRPMVRIMDRFHLIQILYRWMLTSLQRFLPHQWSYILNLSNPPNQTETESKAEELQEIKIDMKPNQQKKWELIQLIKKQPQTGQSIRSLAKAHHLSRNTVKKYIESKEPPTNKRKRRSTLLNGYINLIIIGIENNLSSHRIFEQIKQQGYKGSYRFSQFLYKDLQPILASIYYTYSNGVIEGQINRLKTIKRTLYGRASFELLRKRVLYHM
ncbi:transposase [Schinkia azotoformans]|nr:transposase [Schinkia azotoformans]MEC1778989.1 transposase [Schinkia azotoformans]MED4327885.1 transposase [Schinkia azotoformans]